MKFQLKGSGQIMKSTKIVVLAFVCLSGGLTACKAAHTEEHESAAYAATSPLKTDTTIVHEYVSQIKAIQHIEMRAMAQGFLQDIYVDEGKSVKKGQRMFQIMPLLYQAETEKAQAEAQFAEIEYGNTKTLNDGNVVSPNELAMSKAKWDKAKAELSLAKTHLAFTEVKAPFDGIMNRLMVRRGSLLEEGDLITTLSDNSQMWVYFNVTESEYLNYKQHADPSNPTPVKLMMANGQIFDQIGKIETIEADFNNETGNLAFRATFSNPNGLLRHGETGKILMTLPLKGVVLIPQQATFDVLDKKYVFVIDDKDIAHSREITVAEELPHLFVVGTGLEASDKILIDGLRKVRDGDHVATTYQEPTKVMSSLDLPAE